MAADRARRRLVHWDMSQASAQDPVRTSGSDGGGTIAVVVNGRPMQVAAGTTVRGVIESLGLGKSPCAAELNKGLVPRREHEARALAEGDSLEIVSLVGGG